jgi:hypothetical protein
MEPVKDAEHHRPCVRPGRRRTSGLAAAILTLTLAVAASAAVSNAQEPGGAAQTSAAFGRWGFDRTQEQVQAIVTEAARSGAALDTDIGKIGTLYNAFMDEDRIERPDLAPIAADLAEIRDATTKAAIAAPTGRSRHGLKKRASGDVSQPAPVAWDG